MLFDPGFYIILLCFIEKNTVKWYNIISEFKRRAMKKQEFFINCDGTDIHCIQWLPANGNIKAVLQIVHGMIEYIDRYDSFAAFLCSRGIAVVGHDHPGHGYTAKDESALGVIRRKGGSDHLVACTHCVTEYIKQEFPEYRLFILGHSMGSFVVRRYITKFSPEICGACIMGTASQPLPVLVIGRALAGLISKIKGEAHPSRLLTDISFAGYNKRFPKEEGIHAWISSDRDVVKKYDNDPFCSYIFSAGGFGVLYDTIYALEKKFDFNNIRKDLPVLVNAGREDPVGAYGKGPEACVAVLKDTGLEDVTLMLYDGMRHEILNEKDNKRVYEDILAWINNYTD